MKTLEERFWSKVHTRGPDDCWEWTGCRLPAGYGKIGVRGRTEYATRVLWQMMHGPIPDGLYVCHHCDNPPCVNPAHLFLGTGKDNARDSARKGRLFFQSKRCRQIVSQRMSSVPTEEMVRRGRIGKQGMTPAARQVAAGRAIMTRHERYRNVTPTRDWR